MAAGRTGSGSVVVGSGSACGGGGSSSGGGGSEVTFEEYVRCLDVLHDASATRPVRGLARRAVQHLRRACGWSDIVPAHKSPRVVALREKAAAHRMRQLTAVRHGYLCGRLRYETNVLVPFSPHDSFRSGVAPRRRRRRPQTRAPADPATSLPPSPSPPPKRDFTLSLPRSPRLAAAASAAGAAQPPPPPPPQRWQPSRASRRARLCVRKEERGRRPTTGGDERSPLLIGCSQRGRSVSSVREEQEVSGG